MVVAATLLTAACQAPPPPVGVLGEVQGFAGGVAADEPVAVLAAQRILQNGGSAVDAAVALYFAMAVTYPVGAGLGGGGVCLVYDALTRTADTVEFLPGSADEVGPVAIPGSVRGLAALHARYGRLPWELLLGPAGDLARDGFPVSRALARALAAAEPIVLGDDTLRARFAPDGKTLSEGQNLVQIELGAVISQIARNGGGAFYVGTTARLIVEEMAELGATVTPGDLRGFKPVWRDAVSIRLGDLVVYTVPPSPTGGIISGQMWAMFTDGDRFVEADAEERPHLVAEVSARAFADLTTPLEKNEFSAFRAHALMQDYQSDRHVALTTPEEPSWGEDPGAGALYSASFAVVDRGGSAVGCSLTMNGVIGTAGTTRLTGFSLAPSLDRTGASHHFGPLLVLDAERGDMLYLATASGSPAGPAVIAQTAQFALYDDISLAAALAAPRLFHGGTPDVVFYEADLGQAGTRALTRRGHEVREVGSLGRINAIRCPEGLLRRSEGCSFAADPRGHGIGFGGLSQ